MQGKAQASRRRVHGAQIKAKVLEQCREPGASVASVAMANGLNANLVRKWLEGRGLKRAGLTVDGEQPSGVRQVTAPTRTTPMATAAPGLQFVPVGLPAPNDVNDMAAAATAGAPAAAPHIEVELRGGSACLAVRWPLSQAEGCAAWLNELAGAVLQSSARR